MHTHLNLQIFSIRYIVYLHYLAILICTLTDSFLPSAHQCHPPMPPTQHEFHETCHSVKFHFMQRDSKRCCDTTTPESIHAKDESKRGFAFAFIFGVNWPVQWILTEWQVSWNSWAYFMCHGYCATFVLSSCFCQSYKSIPDEKFPAMSLFVLKSCTSSELRVLLLFVSSPGAAFLPPWISSSGWEPL